MPIFLLCHMKHLQVIRVLLPDVRYEIRETQLDILFANLTTGTFPAIQFPATGNRILAKKSWQIFLLSGGTVGRPREWSKELNMIELWIVEWDSWDLVRLLLGMNDPYVSQPLVLHASGTITLRTIYCNTHYWQYNILQYLLTTTQYIGIVRWPNTIYCIVRSDQYNILYCRDKPIQYIVLSGRTNTIYC